MIACEIWYRSQGFTWHFRPGDLLVLKDGTDVLIQIEAELVIDLLISEFHKLKLLHHMKEGTAPRKSLAKILTNDPPPTARNLIEQRRLARKSRKKA